MHFHDEKSATIVRLDLEKAILGACLLENAYAKIADFLKPKHFSIENLDLGLLHNHQMIFSTMQRLYPCTPIDLRTMCCQIPIMRTYLMELSCNVCSSANIVSYAAILLEIDIRFKFMKLLKRLQQESRNLSIRQMISEIQTSAINESNDIIKTVSASITYLREARAESQVIEQIELFNRNICTGIEKVKQLATIDILFRNLQDLSSRSFPYNSIRETLLITMSDVVKKLMSCSDIDPMLRDKILNLH
jgi:replicative DNA helicase